MGNSKYGNIHRFDSKGGANEKDSGDFQESGATPGGGRFLFQGSKKRTGAKKVKRRKKKTREKGKGPLSH